MLRPPPRPSQSGGAPTPAGSVSQARRRHRGQRLPGSDCLRTFNPVSTSHVLTMTLVVRRHLARDAPGHWTFGLTTGVRPDTPVTVRGSRHLRHRVAIALPSWAVRDVPRAWGCVRLLLMVEVAQPGAMCVGVDQSHPFTRFPFDGEEGIGKETALPCSPTRAGTLTATPLTGALARIRWGTLICKNRQSSSSE